MKKLTALVVLAIAMMAGPAMSAGMMGANDTTPMASSFRVELRKQLSPNDYGYVADGVSVEEHEVFIDKHLGVAPTWAGRPDEPLTMRGKAAIELRKQLSPNEYGYVADGVSDGEHGGLIDKHFGIAPAWEGRTEESFTLTEKELRKQLAPNVFGDIVY